MHPFLSCLLALASFSTLAAAGTNCCVVTIRKAQCEGEPVSRNSARDCEDFMNQICLDPGAVASNIRVLDFHYDQPNDVYRGICIYAQTGVSGDAVSSTGIGVHWDCREDPGVDDLRLAGNACKKAG